MSTMYLYKCFSSHSIPTTNRRYLSHKSSFNDFADMSSLALISSINTLAAHVVVTIGFIVSKCMHLCSLFLMDLIAQVKPPGSIDACNLHSHVCAEHKSVYLELVSPSNNYSKTTLDRVIPHHTSQCCLSDTIGLVLA